MPRPAAACAQNCRQGGARLPPRGGARHRLLDEGCADHGKLVWACKEEHLGEASHKRPKTHVSGFDTPSKRSKLRLAVARVGTRATSGTNAPLPAINHAGRAGKAPAAAGQSHRQKTAKRMCPSHRDVATQAGRPLATTLTRTVLPDVTSTAPKPVAASVQTLPQTPPLLTKTETLFCEPATPLPDLRPTGQPTVPETSTCCTPKLAVMLSKQRERKHTDMFQGQNNDNHTAKLKQCNAAAQEALYALHARDESQAPNVFKDRSASMLLSIADHMGIRENVARVFGGGEKLSPMYYVRLRYRTSMAWRRVYQTRAHAARRFKASDHVHVCSEQDIRDARDSLPIPPVQRLSPADAAVVGKSCRCECAHAAWCRTRTFGMAPALRPREPPPCSSTRQRMPKNPRAHAQVHAGDQMHACFPRGRVYAKVFAFQRQRCG